MPEGLVSGRLFVLVNPVSYQYRYYQYWRYDKKRYITFQVVGYELVESLNDSFSKCLKEFHITAKIVQNFE